MTDADALMLIRRALYLHSHNHLALVATNAELVHHVTAMAAAEHAAGIARRQADARARHNDDRTDRDPAIDAPENGLGKVHSE